MRAYFDNNNDLIGLNDENNPLSEKFKELNEEEYQAIISGVNKEIRISEEGTLLFMEKPPDMPKELEELKKLEEENRKAAALEKQKQEMVFTNLETLEQIILEIVNALSDNLKGGENMELLCTLMVNNILLEKMTFAKVPKVLQPKVKEMLVSMDLGFLAE